MNRHVLITRSPEDCRRLQELASGSGLTIRPYPVIRLEEFVDEDGWRRALAEAESAEGGWLLFASPRAPRPFIDQASRRDATALTRWPAAAVGPGTARAASGAGLGVELTGPGTGLALARELIHRLGQPATLVFPCGYHRRPELPEALQAAGPTVVPVVVYRMRATPPRELPPLGPRVDVVVLTSPRAARLYLEGVGGRPLDCPHWALGPTTRDAAGALGIECRVPAEPNLETLVEELCKS